MTTRLDDTGLTFSDASLQAIAAGQLPGYLFGYTMSTAGASTTMSITAGKAQDSTGVQLMTLTAIAKTTAAWLLGTAAGGLDTGAIAVNSWYHFYVIRRPDTGVVDVVFSLSATAPTLPAAFTQFRRIGSGRTNPSSQWTKFSQNGDEFLWDVASADVVGFTGSTSIQPATLLVPLGVKTNAIITAAGLIGGAGTNARGYVFSPDINLAIALASLSNMNFGGTGAANTQFWSQLTIRANTASQVYFSIDAANGSVYINTHGYIDTRGRVA